MAIKLPSFLTLPAPWQRQLKESRLPLRHPRLLLVHLWQKTLRDDLPSIAAALSFVTLVSLVPLLAALTLTGVQTFRPQIIELLTRILPYSEESLITTLDQILVGAADVRGPGVILFVLSALSLFSAVGGALNRIWGGTSSNALRSRLLSLTLLLFWGPLLLGAALSGLDLLRRQPGFALLLGSPFIAELVTAGAFLVGLSMLYWQVPKAGVHFASAAFGGLAATLAMMLLRHGFGLYVQLAAQTNRVYGSFAFLFLFVISVYCAWIIVLAGSELAYVHQHFLTLVRSRQRRVPVQTPWLGLALLILLARRLRRAQPVTSKPSLSRQLQVPREELQRALRPLTSCGMVQEIQDEDKIVLAREPALLKIESVFRCYEPQAEELPPADPLLPGLQELRRRLQEARGSSLGEMTLAQVVEEIPGPAAATDGEPTAGRAGELAGP